MYKSRKKILLVCGTSAAVLAAFGIGSWAIVDSSNRIPVDNKIKSELSGATAYLNNTSFVYKQMSIDDWMFYNFPKYAIPSTTNGTTTIDFYSSLTGLTTGNNLTQDILDKSQQSLLFTVKLNSNYTHFEVWTSRYQDTNNKTGIMLVSSDVSLSTSSLSIANKYYWDSNVETITLNKSTDSYIGSSELSPKSSVSYKNENGSTNEQNGYTSSKNYVTEVKSNTDAVLWNRKYTQTSSSSKNFTLEYSSDSLTSADKPIKQTFNYTSANNSGAVNKETTEQKLSYFTINYTSGTNNTQISDKQAFLTKIGYEKNDDGTINSKISSGYEYSFLPIVMLDKNNK